MKRLTIKGSEGVTVPDSEVQNALRRLAAFEDVYNELAENMAAIPVELEKLKAAGKEKTVRYRELFGQKLMNGEIIAMFERHGILFRGEE